MLVDNRALLAGPKEPVRNLKVEGGEHDNHELRVLSSTHLLAFLSLYFCLASV